MASEAIARQAVVIGAGIAGLAAAGALSDHFEQVVVLERDSLSDGPVHRPGTPQSRHAHGLLVGGQRALSALFPGFERDLVEAGAVPVGASIDTRFERPGYDPFPQRDLGLVSYALSRPAIEFAVRKRLRSCANISLRDRCRVGDLLASPDGMGATHPRIGNRCLPSGGCRQRAPVVRSCGRSKEIAGSSASANATAMRHPVMSMASWLSPEACVRRHSTTP